MSVISASRKGYSLALEVSERPINMTEYSTVILPIQSCKTSTGIPLPHSVLTLPALLWSSLTAPKFRGLLNKASYDSFKLSDGHCVLVLLFPVCYIAPWFIQVRSSIPTDFSLDLITGIDETKYDKRHLNTMPPKMPCHLVLWLRSKMDSVSNVVHWPVWVESESTPYNFFFRDV